MASGNIARRSGVADVTAILDSPEVRSLIAAVEAVGDNRGRKGFGTHALVGAGLVKGLFALPTWTWVAALIAEHPGLQDALGGSPSVWACYRFSTKLRRNHPALAECIDATAESLRERLPDFGRDIAIDASDLPAYANGQRYVSKGGKERERYSDPEASWGHRSAVSTRGSGGFYGFKIHAAVCARTELPIAWRIETAKAHESSFALPLFDAVLGRGFKPETCAMDKGYDTVAIHDGFEERGCSPVVPIKGKQPKVSLPPSEKPSRFNPKIQRHTERFKRLYRGRASVERAFGRAKHDHGLLPLRVRGLDRIGLHADLVMLAQLTKALSHSRTVALAA